MTIPAKIKIECDDPLLNAAIASAIADGLERANFNNVQVRSLMVYRESEHKADIPVPGFDKRNIVDAALGEDVMSKRTGYRQPLVLTELHPSWVLGHPYIVDHLRQTRPELLGSPVLLDMGEEPPDYTKNLRAFFSGEVKAQVRNPAREEV